MKNIECMQMQDLFDDLLIAYELSVRHFGEERNANELRSIQQIHNYKAKADRVLSLFHRDSWMEYPFAKTAKETESDKINGFLDEIDNQAFSKMLHALSVAITDGSKYLNLKLAPSNSVGFNGVECSTCQKTFVSNAQLHYVAAQRVAISVTTQIIEGSRSLLAPLIEEFISQGFTNIFGNLFEIKFSELSNYCSDFALQCVDFDEYWRHYHCHTHPPCRTCQSPMNWKRFKSDNKLVA